MSNKKIIITAVILAVAIIVGALIWSGRQKTIPPVQKTAGIVFGSDSAPVTIEEYTNFLCSHCADFALTTWPQIKDKYVTVGKVKFVIYVVSYVEVGKAGYCASLGDKYLEFQDDVFSHMSELTSAIGNNADQKIFDFAQASGLDLDKFKACYLSSAATKAANDWLDKARESSVGSTPTFFINGEKVVGAQAFEQFDKIIQSKLK